MRGLRSVVLVAGLLTIAVHAPAVAQLRFAIGGGATLPTGTFDDVAGTGWHGMGAIGFQPADFPIGIQVDGMYSRFGVDVAENIDADVVRENMSAFPALAFASVITSARALLASLNDSAS